MAGKACKRCLGLKEITYGQAGLSGKCRAICPDCRGTGKDDLCVVCEGSMVECPFCDEGSRISDQSPNP